MVVFGSTKPKNPSGRSKSSLSTTFLQISEQEKTHLRDVLIIDNIVQYVVNIRIGHKRAAPVTLTLAVMPTTTATGLRARGVLAAHARRLDEGSLGQRGTRTLTATDAATGTRTGHRECDATLADGG